MRALADFFMQSRSRATVSAVATAFIPFLSIISGAILALVWLRMGRNEGLKVLLWASLPGLYYLVFQDSPDVFLALAFAALLAELLRVTQSWHQVLVVATALAGVVAMSFQWLPAAIQDELLKLLMDQETLIDSAELTASEQQRLEVLLARLLNGVITAVQLLMVLASLFLGRWWQALLYNPGGFQAEFHRLKMPAWYSGLVLLSLIALTSGVDILSALLPVLLVPLLISGLALVHGIVGLKHYNSFWLGMLYVLLLFALPYLSVLLVLIAMADSLMNFRQRLAPPSPPSGE